MTTATNRNSPPASAPATTVPSTSESVTETDRVEDLRREVLS